MVLTIIMCFDHDCEREKGTLRKRTLSYMIHYDIPMRVMLLSMFPKRQKIAESIVDVQLPLPKIVLV